MPAETVETLIFEAKLKDELSKGFDAWDARLKSLEKQWNQTFRTIKISMNEMASQLRATQRILRGIDTDLLKTLKGFSNFSKAKDVLRDMGETAKKTEKQTADFFTQTTKAAQKSQGVLMKVAGIGFGSLVRAVEVAEKSLKTLKERGFKQAQNAGKNVLGMLKNLQKGFQNLALKAVKMAFQGVIGVFKKLAETGKNTFNKLIEWTKEFAIDSVKHWLNFENILTVVTRTTGESWETVLGFGQALRDMSLSLGDFAEGGAFESMGLKAGIAAEELAKIAGIAGQLGMDSIQEIQKFAWTIGRMATTTDLSASKAAELMAQLGELFNLDSTGVEKLANVINELGNTSVATQSAIGEMSRRMAGVMEFMGITADKVAGYAAAMREVGVTVRVGGTAMSQFMMMLASQGKKLATSLGLDWTMLKQTLESNDPSPAIELVLTKINELKREGGRITIAEKLREIGITGYRLQDTLLKLSGNVGVLRNKLATAAKEWKAQQSMQKEYNKILERTGHKFQEFWRYVDEIKKVVGEDLSKAFADFTQKYLTPFVKTILEFVKSRTFQNLLEVELPKALEWVGEKIEWVNVRFQQFIDLADKVGVWKAFTETVRKLWKDFREGVEAEWKLFKQNVWSQVENWLTNLQFKINETFAPETADKLNQWIEAFKDFPSLIENLSNAAINLPETFKQIAATIANVAIEIETIGGVIRETTKVIIDFIEKIPGMGGGKERRAEKNAQIQSLTWLAQSYANMKKPIEEAVQAMMELNKQIGLSSGEVEELARRAYKQSVFPDMSEWIRTNISDTEKLGAELQRVTGYLKDMETVKTNPMLAVFQAPDATRPQKQVELEMYQRQLKVAIRASQQEGAAIPQEAQVQKQGIHIHFEGTNVVDEHTLGSFVKKITDVQRQQAGFVYST
jgi:TP901 family phage tail tape measure protein